MDNAIEIEAAADAAAEQGYVSEVLDIVRKNDVPPNVRDRLDDILLRAVENAAKNGRLSDALDVLGADCVSAEAQIWSAEILVQNGRTDWLSKVLGIQEVPADVGEEIVGFLANEGFLSSMIKIAKGDFGLKNEKEVPERVKQKAKELLAECVEKSGELGLRKLSHEELVSLSGLLSRNLLARNPLQGNGVLSQGTVKKPSSVRQESGPAKKASGMKS
jgi:hypothetical protein